MTELTIQDVDAFLHCDEIHILEVNKTTCCPDQERLDRVPGFRQRRLAPIL